MSPAARTLDAALRWYQRSLSPRKGFRCAAGAAGGPSCSTAVRHAVARNGVLGAIRPSALQLVACAQAASLLMTADVQGVCCCGGIPIPFRFGR